MSRFYGGGSLAGVVFEGEINGGAKSVLYKTDRAQRGGLKFTN